MGRERQKESNRLKSDAYREREGETKIERVRERKRGRKDGERKRVTGRERWNWRERGG